MENNIIKIAENRDAILELPCIFCPVCGTRWFSGFDKLYVKAYGICYMCDDSEDSEDKSNNILSILEA